MAKRRKPAHIPSTEKDDGTRWLVVRDGKPIYASRVGTTRAEAERLAGGLLRPAEIIEITPQPA